MNVSEVERELKAVFAKELTNHCRRHVVFWYDENGDFLDDIDNLKLDNVRILRLTDHNLFATKYELEKADPESHFLIYANRAKPAVKEDWLYSQYKLGTEFVTDKVSMTMRELGVENEALRPVFQKYATFFNNKARKAAFQSYTATYDKAETIDLIVLAVLVKSPFLTLDDVVRTLLKEEVSDHNKLWENIEKFGDVETFWRMIERDYGYRLKERSLSSLVTFFILTYLSEQIPTEHFPEDWRAFVSPQPMNVIVFMNQWMNHRIDRESYNKIANEYEDFLNVKGYVANWEIETIQSADVFQMFDEHVIAYLQDQLVEDVNQFHTYEQLLLNRRRLHWYPEFRLDYEAITYAKLLLKFAHEKEQFIPEQSAFHMFNAYRADYYRADLYYRKFYSAYDRMERKERLAKLREKVENVYTNWFLRDLSIKWMNSIERMEKKQLKIDGISQQRQFYQTVVQPFIKAGERVFVIISDALRYEAAKELVDRLNNERKASTALTVMQSVIPSYTDLGMAALLPHKTIDMDGQHIFVHGLRASNTDHREAILNRYVAESVVIPFSDLVSKNRNEMRTLFAGKKLIYIFHNAIDARGDHAATEMSVFEAVDEAIEDIRILVHQLVNHVSASNIVITADHGFLYQRDRLEERDKMPKEADHALIVKRRFILSEEALHLEGTLTFELEDVFHNNNPIYVTIPKGTGRFAVQGAGVNYVHGGAMLQEIVVPLITFKNDRSKSSKNDVRKVDVKLTTLVRKITNEITYLEFFQTEKVEEKRQPLRIKLYFINEDGERISNENIIIADSQSANPKERTYREKFVFRTIPYDKSSSYYLVLEDEKEETIYEKLPFTIDISFSDDVGH